MKARFVEKGANRYVTGEVTQFDQKNEMFCRSLWDSDMLEVGKKFYMDEDPLEPERDDGVCSLMRKGCTDSGCEGSFGKCMPVIGAGNTPSGKGRRID